MSTISKAIASNTTADVYVFNNTRFIVREEPMPSWAGEILESLEALNRKLDQHDNDDENLESLEEPIPTWARALMEEIDQLDMRLRKLESLDESNSWEDNSPQIEITKEPINDHLDFSNVVPSNDHYPRDMIDYQYNEVRVDIPMFKEVDDPKEYLNEDMTSSLPKTTQVTNPTPRSNSIIRCYKCRKVGHVKADCSKLIIVMDDSNPLPTNDSKEFELEDEIHELDKAISIKHVHIIHDIVLKEFASSYERYETFICPPASVPRCWLRLAHGVYQPRRHPSPHHAYGACRHPRPCTQFRGHCCPSAPRTSSFPRRHSPQPSSTGRPCHVRTASLVRTDRARAPQVRHTSPSLYFGVPSFHMVLPPPFSTALGT